MSDQSDSPNVNLLRKQLAEGQVSRREFVRYAALLGVAVAVPLTLLVAWLGRAPGGSPHAISAAPS